MSDIPAVRVRVSEQNFIVVTALANVRAARCAAGEIAPGVDGVISYDEVKAVMRALWKMEAKLTFVMGTTDEEDLKLAMEDCP